MKQVRNSNDFIWRLVQIEYLAEWLDFQISILSPAVYSQGLNNRADVIRESMERIRSDLFTIGSVLRDSRSNPRLERGGSYES